MLPSYHTQMGFMAVVLISLQRIINYNSSTVETRLDAEWLRQRDEYSWCLLIGGAGCLQKSSFLFCLRHSALTEGKILLGGEKKKKEFMDQMNIKTVFCHPCVRRHAYQKIQVHSTMVTQRCE